MNEKIKEEHSHFFKEMKKFKEKQTKQKERGLNDYNLLTTVLSADDEVRLHSRMIHSLLDPNGWHYQGSLFLEIFLDVINFHNKNFDTENADVKVEYKQIDLYITDGKYHIIIENKVNADDQEAQIKRYIEIIRDDNKESLENITVIYLSVDRKEPSEYSLGKIALDQENEYFIIENDELRYKGNNESLKGCSTKFKSIHYKKDILDWLNKCKHEVQNITNLNEAIKQYIEVVKIISGIDTSKSKQIKDFLGENTNRMKIAADIYKSKIFDNDDNTEFVEDVHNNFLKTLDEKYKFVGKSIGKSLIKRLKEKGVNTIKDIQPFILNTPKKRYANDHYIDLILENGIRIQLQYKNDFNKLYSINVYQGNYHKKIDSQRRGININFKIDDFYELLTKKDDIEKICNEHIENTELIEQLQEAIKYANNIENLSDGDN
ncbi:MAG: hypothetical protein DRQ78_03920 [Epsilonproteobacteria bacterium]|nr:MAG: hypothetical protein DRQ78_03920 [Campylobacterota bacterium]